MSALTYVQMPWAWVLYVCHSVTHGDCMYVIRVVCMFVQYVCHIWHLDKCVHTPVLKRLYANMTRHTLTHIHWNCCTLKDKANISRKACGWHALIRMHAHTCMRTDSLRFEERDRWTIIYTNAHAHTHKKHKIYGYSHVKGGVCRNTRMSFHSQLCSS